MFISHHDHDHIISHTYVMFTSHHDHVVDYIPPTHSHVHIPSRSWPHAYCCCCLYVMFMFMYITFYVHDDCCIAKCDTPISSMFCCWAWMGQTTLKLVREGGHAHATEAIVTHVYVLSFMFISYAHTMSAHHKYMLSLYACHACMH